MVKSIHQCFGVAMYMTLRKWFSNPGVAQPPGTAQLQEPQQQRGDCPWRQRVSFLHQDWRLPLWRQVRWIMVHVICNNSNGNCIDRWNSRFLQSPYCDVNCLQLVRSSGPGAIVCKSRATYWVRITCNLHCATWYEGIAQLLSLTEFKIAFILALFYWLQPLNDEGGEETGVLGKKSWRQASGL